MSWNILPRWLSTEARRKDSPPRIDEKASESDVRTVDIPITKQPEEDYFNEAEKTPKAQPTKGSQDVPSLSLNSDHEDMTYANSKDGPDAVLKRQTPISAQKATSMLPPPNPTKGAKGSTSGLMPPPAQASVARRMPPTSVAPSLRVPSTGPLPNRGPPAGSQQRVSNSLSPNSAVVTPNARGKVLLSPGHSPMDWAALTRSGNLAGVDTFQRVRPSELRKMTGRKGKPAWSSWQGKVYNITPYLPFHPGGEGELMRAAGRDGTKLFMENHPWVNWENMLGTCLVGVMVPEDHGTGQGQSSLEDMD